MIVCGIDYSMSCPGICVFEGDNTFDVQKCQIHYIINSKKLGGVKRHNISGHEYPIYKNNTERFYRLAEWVIRVLGKKPDLVILEGYSYGSKGTVFEIGENTGILKLNLFLNKIKFQVIAPTTLKKFATGNGQSKKQEIYTKFVEETGLDPRKFLGRSRLKSVGSPETDIADSYFLCKFAHQVSTGAIKLGRKAL